MAAGTVTIQKVLGRNPVGLRVVMGKVTLDGSNPTPVALAAYLSEVQGAVVSLLTAAIPVDGLMGASVGVSGSTLNVYAWGTDGTDPTPSASTVNDKDVAFVAWGVPA